MKFSESCPYEQLEGAVQQLRALQALQRQVAPQRCDMDLNEFVLDRAALTRAAHDRLSEDQAALNKAALNKAVLDRAVAALNGAALNHAMTVTGTDRGRSKASPKPVPPMVDDDLKPDPSTASTMEELRQLLRDLWEWSGRPSTRRVAAASQGAFSHATIAKILNGSSQVPLTLEYTRGLVLGCGGGPCEVSLWVTAWRRIELNRPAVRALRVVNE